jgi:hypothetical protein
MTNERGLLICTCPDRESPRREPTHAPECVRSWEWDGVDGYPT